LNPVLFGSKAKAGAPHNISSNRTNFSRLTYNTARLNAIYITVTDVNNNPVEGAVVSPSGSGGLTILPGLYEGTYFPDFTTNVDGLWVGLVSASSVTPTIDEFGGTGTGGLAATYSISVSVVGVGTSESYNVDVDMGPSMVTQSLQGDSAIITKDLTNPVMKRVFRYQRKDTYIPVSGSDDDSGDWRDEGFSPSNLSLIPIEGVPIKFTSYREDGETESGAIQPTKVNNSAEVTIATDALGLAEVNVKMSDVGGSIKIKSEVIGGINVTFKNDSGGSGQDGLVLHDPAQPSNPNLFSDENSFAETTSLIATPVELTITIDDKNGLMSNQVSGIDLTTLQVTLMGAVTKTLFNGATNPGLPLGKFPYYMRILLDGNEQSIWPTAAVVSAGGFADMVLIYRPSGNELAVGTNNIRVSGGLKDKVDNTAPAADVDLPFPF